jgi:hypothetical protein
MIPLSRAPTMTEPRVFNVYFYIFILYFITLALIHLNGSSHFKGKGPITWSKKETLNY